MRKFFASAAALVFSAAAAHAISFLPPGPATLQFEATTQATSFHLVSSKTNRTATATNVMIVDSETVSSTPFVSSNLLALLTNSFNTNFPAGSRIGFSFGSLVVMDSSGSNIFFPSPVLTSTFNEGVVSEKQTEISTQNKNGSSLSGNSTAADINDITIIYDDSTVSPGDGIHSTFQLRGLLVQKISRNIKTNFEKVNYEFQGSGGGTVHGVQTILKGTIKAQAAGAPPPI